MIQLLYRLLTAWLAKGFGLPFLMEAPDDISFPKHTEGYTTKLKELYLVTI